jgi:hypothetical protein
MAHARKRGTHQPLARERAASPGPGKVAERHYRIVVRGLVPDDLVLRVSAAHAKAIELASPSATHQDGEGQGAAA